MKLLNFRVSVYLAIILGFGGVFSSLFAQYVLGMNPCVMCIQQRMALLGVGLTAILALFFPPRTWGRITGALMISSPAVFGLWIAVKQIYLQSLPLMAQPSCGAPWTFRWRNAPFFEYYEWFLRGTGACGEIYRVFGIALPVWGALFFVMILLIVWLGFWRTVCEK